MALHRGECARPNADPDSAVRPQASTIPLRVFGSSAWLDRVGACMGRGLRRRVAFGAGLSAPVVQERFTLGDGRAVDGWRVGAVHYSDYLDFPDVERVDERGVAELMEKAGRAGCAFLLFSNVPRGTPLGNALSGLGGTLSRLQCQPTLGVDAALGAEQWWASLGPGSRRRVRRYRRKLDDAGAVLALEPATARGIEIFLALQHARANRTALQSMAGDGALAALVRSLAGQPMALLATLRIEGSCRAALLLLQDDRSVGIYAQGFDPAIARLSPGSGLFGFVLEQAFAGRWRYVDFLRGDEPYKRHLATETVAMDKFLWVAPGAPPGVGSFIAGLVE